jgi:hypothetical protein
MPMIMQANRARVDTIEILGACDGADRECRSGFCLIKLAPMTNEGCKDCKCRATTPLCDADYNCVSLKCRDQRGCVGCRCATGGQCDASPAGLSCNANDVCVFASQSSTTPAPPAVSQCPKGGERCECLDDNTCTYQFLECKNGRCNVIFDDPVLQGTSAVIDVRTPSPNSANDDADIGLIVGVSIGALCCIICLIVVAIGVVVVVVSNRALVVVVCDGFSFAVDVSSDVRGRAPTMRKW